MAWITPKTNWNPGNGIMASDLNRIEDNISSIQKIMRYSYSLGGYYEPPPLPIPGVSVVAAAVIAQQPGARLMINAFGLYPSNAVAYCIIRNEPPRSYTSSAMFDGAVGGGAFTLSPDVMWKSTLVNEVTKFYVYLGFETNSTGSLYANIINLPVDANA
jgi:hypothetical protein